MSDDVQQGEAQGHGEQWQAAPFATLDAPQHTPAPAHDAALPVPEASPVVFAPAPQRPPRLGSLRTVVSVVAAVIVVGGGIARFVSTQHGGASTDGTFHTGDCVVLTDTRVKSADCGATHDGRITAVLHQSTDTCPSGSDEFDVTDDTGNLCVDRSDTSH